MRNMVCTNEKYGRVHIKYAKPISLKEKIVEYFNSKSIDQRMVFSRSNIGQSCE